MHTTAFWLHFPAQFLAQFDVTPVEKQAGLAAIGNAMRPVAALLLMCEPHDLGLVITDEITAAAYEPDLYLYDSYPGGVGLSAPLYRLAPKLLAATEELIIRCRCDAGCPSCVGPVGEIGERGKEIALRILSALH
jgi:DEAD/DEAH box helicase domain-containing protein